MPMHYINIFMERHWLLLTLLWNSQAKSIIIASHEWKHHPKCTSKVHRYYMHKNGEGGGNMALDIFTLSEIWTISCYDTSTVPGRHRFNYIRIKCMLLFKMWKLDFVFNENRYTRILISRHIYRPFIYLQHFMIFHFLILHNYFQCVWQ